ncbi:hypothetical protein AgCh_026420 [Apium graveolens]
MCVSTSEDVQEEVLGVRNNGEPVLAKSNNFIAYNLDSHEANDFVDSWDRWWTPKSPYQEGYAPQKNLDARERELEREAEFEEKSSEEKPNSKYQRLTGRQERSKKCRHFSRQRQIFPSLGTDFFGLGSIALASYLSVQRPRQTFPSLGTEFRVFENLTDIIHRVSDPFFPDERRRDYF